MLYNAMAMVAGKGRHGQGASLATNSTFADKMEFLGCT
ncbi:hypothetical protein SLEP1_g40383 [Rubroshorea leprosula]|uniref:Uncharacterized protein n=1 Tax=Rubroshorea leprosula TaxID=152421 RepID=A0AAV5L3K1_9ROSI|nr:hypothetical protein SLEP1_g40383 [Rubroshorea leprosula]